MGGCLMQTNKVSVRALAAGIALALTGGVALAQEPVKIGFVTELTGPWAFFGTSCVAGLKLADAQINPAGKRKIEFVTIDNQTQPAQPVAAFPQLTKPGSRYTFRIEPDAAGWGYAIAQFVAKQKPSAKIALVYSDF